MYVIYCIKIWGGGSFEFIAEMLFILLACCHNLPPLCFCSRGLHFTSFGLLLRLLIGLWVVIFILCVLEREASTLALVSCW